MIGDAQTTPEYGVRKEQIRAIINAVQRKGKFLKQGNFRWIFFEAVWIRIIFLRPLFTKIYSIISLKKEQ